MLGSKGGWKLKDHWKSTLWPEERWAGVCPILVVGREGDARQRIGGCGGGWEADGGDSWEEDLKPPRFQAVKTSRGQPEATIQNRNVRWRLTSGDSLKKH